MKAPILFLVLLTFISTAKVESNFVDKIKCLISNEAIKKSVVDFIEVVKTKDVHNIIKALFEGYSVIEKEVLKCWNDEPLLLSPKPAKTKKPLPEKRKPTECESKCYGGCMHIKKHIEYALCAEDCIKKNCK